MRSSAPSGGVVRLLANSPGRDGGPGRRRKAGSAVTAVSVRPARTVAAPRRGLGQLLDATTPGRLRLLLAGLIAMCLAWGVVAAWVVSQRASGAGDVVSVSEPVALDGQQIYRA